MKRAFSGILILAVLILIAFSVVTQTSIGQTNPAPDGKSVPSFRPRREDPRNRIRVSDDPTDNIIIGFRPLSNIRRELKEKLRISDSEKDRYKLLAGDKKANIARILSSFSCSTTLVVDISDPRCLENPDFAIGSFYSFRYKDYGEGPWTDLSLIEDELNAGNKWHTVGFLSDLGNGVEFSTLNGKTEEIKTLRDFPPAETMAEKAKQKTELEEGRTSGGLFLTSKMKIRAGHVYMLRTISYRLEGGGQMFIGGFNWYNTDTLFIFKIVELDADKTATVAWKKISQKVAPVLTDKGKKSAE